jgi:ABC-type branched-subunit amino acid transport system ATPase component
MGLTPAASGSIRFGGKEIATTPTHIITRMGVALVPQGRQIFHTLTVEEYLTIGVRPTQPGERIALPRGPRPQAWRTRSCQGIVLDEAGEPAGRFRCRPIR